MQQMNNLKKQEVFLKELIEAFPEIRDEIMDEDYLGLITLQIGCFKRFTQIAIDKNELDVIKKCFLFVDENIEIVEYAVKNALYISYLGHLNIPKKSKANKLLTINLKNILAELDKYNKSVSKNEKLNKFINDLRK